MRPLAAAAFLAAGSAACLAPARGRLSEAAAGAGAPPRAVPAAPRSLAYADTVAPPSRGARVGAEAGDRINLEAGAEAGLVAGAELECFHEGAEVAVPAGGRVLGREEVALGRARVLGPAEDARGTVARILPGEGAPFVEGALCRRPSR